MRVTLGPSVISKRSLSLNWLKEEREKVAEGEEGGRRKQKEEEGKEGQQVDLQKRIACRFRSSWIQSLQEARAASV